jgi:hypothetical protein
MGVRKINKWCNYVRKGASDGGVIETIVSTLFVSPFQVVWFAVSVALYGCFSVSDLFLILRLVSSVVLRLVPSVVLSHPAAT